MVVKCSDCLTRFCKRTWTVGKVVVLSFHTRYILYIFKTMLQIKQGTLAKLLSLKFPRKIVTCMHRYSNIFVTFFSFLLTHLSHNLSFLFFVSHFQNNKEPFNKAFLMNVGFLESLRFNEWDCFVHHDVDHIPLSYANYYGCGQMPRHFMSGEDTWDYK